MKCKNPTCKNEVVKDKKTGRHKPHCDDPVCKEYIEARFCRYGISLDQSISMEQRATIEALARTGDKAAKRELREKYRARIVPREEWPSVEMYGKGNLRPL